MPCVTRARGYQLPYRPADDRRERLTSAVELARWVLNVDDLHPQHRTRLLKQAVWFATECDGKLTPRFRTRAAMDFAGDDYQRALQHEHVVPLAVLVERLLAARGDVEQIITGAPACLVTCSEHKALTRFDRTHDGWDRYRAAGIDVIDALTGATFLPGRDPQLPPDSAAGARASTPKHSRGTQLSRSEPPGRYAEFWSSLRVRLSAEHQHWHAGADRGNSLRLPGPAAKCQFQFDFATGGLRHQLLLTGPRAENEARLMALSAVEDVLARSYGDGLRFEYLQGRSQCRMADYLPGGAIRDVERWPEYAEWFCSSGVRMRVALAEVGVL